MLVVGALVIAIVVTAAITYLPTSSAERPEVSNWKGAVVPGAAFFVGNALLVSVSTVLSAVIGLILMALGVAGLVRNRRRSPKS